MNEQQTVVVDPETKRAMMRRRAAQVKCFAACVLPVGIADMATHTGLGGLIFGGAAALALSTVYPDMKEDFGDMLAPVREILAPLNAPIGGRSILDRAIGRYPVQAEGEIEMESLTEEGVEHVEVESKQEIQGAISLFPVYPENERLDLGHVLATGQAFAPHFNALFGKGVIASAVQGSGKSQLLGRLIEQAAKCGVPMVVCDHKGEYAPVTELSFVNGLRAGSPELRDRVTENCQYFELTVENADQFVATVMMYRYQAIIDLPSYGDNWLARAEIVAEVGQALMRYAAKQRKYGALLLPCLVALDEAQLYLPQNVNLLPPEAKKNTEVLDSLNNAYFSLVSNGRSNGYTVVFATQSLTYIAKWAIKSCQIKIFGRHVEKNDLDMCGETISPKIATRADIETFTPGVGVVFGFTPTALVVKFDLRLSRDDSETPGLERLRMPVPQVQRIPEQASSQRSMHAVCLAVITLAREHCTRGQIMQALALSERQYYTIEEYIKTHRSEFTTSRPTSQVSSVSTSTSTSGRDGKIQQENGREVASEVRRSSREVVEVVEVGTSDLTERELRMAAMFYDEKLGINVIMKEFFPGVAGGTPYQKGNAEIMEALRKYNASVRGE